MPYHATLDRLVAAGLQTIHTSIPVYANRNGILARLVAWFPVLFTTYGDVLCSKFGGVWETLWIFKGVRWTHDRYMKINKSPTDSDSNAVGASSFEIWTANLAQSLTVGTLTNSRSFIFGDSNWKFCSRLPHRHPKTWHSDADISDLGFFHVFIFESKKKSKPVGYIQEHCICKLGKLYEVSWKFCLVFIIDFFYSCILGSFDTVTSLCMGFHSKMAAAGLGPSGLTIQLFLS